MSNNRSPSVRSEPRPAEKTEEGPVMKESALAEGSFYQSQVIGKAERRHFFSPPDATLADAVNRDADNVEFTEEEERAVKRKIDVRVLSLVVCSGNAHVLKPFNQNFGITDNNKWTLALSIFYVGYCILEMPANVLQRYIGANRFFFLSLTWWGIASLSFVYAKGYAGLLVLRVLLGIGEAGYYAGMIYYLSFWYLAMRISLCMTGTLPGAIGGLLAFGLVRAHTSIEAIPTLIMAFAILLLLPSFPFSASFLTPRERAIAQARLNRDHRPQSHGGMNGWTGFKAVVNDLNAWALMIIYASCEFTFAPLINQLGFTPLASQGLTVAPYAVGWFMVLFQAWHSDRTRDRGYHIMLSTATSCIGYIVLAALAGARGVGTAFIVSISNCVSIASPQIYFDSEHNFRDGHAIAAACLFASFMCAFLLRTRLARLNRLNAMTVRATGAAEGPEKGQEVVAEGEIWDNDPRYVFMT
ncbi:major facilitator superfamily domain-containing protein [Trametes gibbosa]|nr:major facilitator superfamily domain-containing protein [Trametes gibbosa]KAI0828144.1 major facilitator superfamily domain-containing protein [Trametes gibbosa]